ncbi:hypothetical protein G9464_10385 [Halostella sp. JP-L12]|uniref:hypothetical protein n=1 Tax=Halostella TaxID=1843185 RepID=UPI0013CEB250|nr:MULTISPECIES: hypothetical protein [Halostella]NHN48003.1 hypothetical protein [Halostella sp. JP-L12]
MIRTLLVCLPTAGGGSMVIYECRRCGKDLDSEAERCPYCGQTDVVEYEIG